MNTTPRAPATLEGPEKELWKRILQEMEFTTAELATLQMGLEALGEHRRAMSIIAKEGLVIQSEGALFGSTRQPRSPKMRGRPGLLRFARCGWRPRRNRQGLAGHLAGGKTRCCRIGRRASHREGGQYAKTETVSQQF